MWIISLLLIEYIIQRKIAIDQQKPNQNTVDIHWHAVNLEADPRLPFENDIFQVVTMLAVIEHLDPSGLVGLFKETRRILAPGGMIILTTPSAWTDGLL